MILYAVRRLILMIPLLLGMTVIAFIVSRTIPVDPVVAAIGDQAADHPAVVAAFRAKWGLDQPLPIQYLTYLANLLHGDLGTSLYTHRPVLDDLLDYMPATIELATMTMLISAAVSVPLGILAATRRGGLVDLVIRLVTLVGVAMPIFWLALLALNIFYLHLGIAPAPGRLSVGVIPPPTVTGLYTVDALIAGQFGTFWDAVNHLMLPSLIMACWSIGMLTRVTRTNMLAVLPQDYLQTARGKGAEERRVIWRHAWPNAQIPVVTMIGLAYGDLLTGAILVETIFGWPGIGHYAYEAALSADFPAIMGVTLTFGIVYTFINLAVDLAYGMLDPRVRTLMTVSQT
ncbi:MAG: ABC transporter permease [Candidatus Limnocylindrales bacterium]